jgi:HEAT repeat protein
MWTNRTWLLRILFLVGTVTACTASFADDQATDDLVQMVVNLLTDKDKDLRALGLDQVRTDAKGAAATRQFAGQLPKLPSATQAGLLSALADRADAAALPAVVALLADCRDQTVRAAAVSAVGSLGKASDLPLLLTSLSADSATERAAARSALTRLRGEDVPPAIAKAMKGSPPPIHIAMIEILANRRALNALGNILTDAVDDNPDVRRAAMAALGQLASAEYIPGMFNGVLKAAKGAERDAAEKAVASVCSRIEDPQQEAILAAWSKFDQEDQLGLLPTLGRVGGAKVYLAVKAAVTSDDGPRREAGLRALCNWPDASVADDLFRLSQGADSAAHRAMTFPALVRVGSLRDARTDLERLDRMKQAMSIAKSDEERSLVINRCRASYAIESLRFVLPYLDQPEFVQVACETIVELAHHRELREPNESEFDPALDRVIQLSKDEVVVDRAGRYKRGETWERPKPTEATNSQ